MLILARLHREAALLQALEQRALVARGGRARADHRRRQLHRVAHEVHLRQNRQPPDQATALSGLRGSSACWDRELCMPACSPSAGG